MSETFGVWELRERLGQNELGDTHLAVRTSDGARAVIKRIRRDLGDERLAAVIAQELSLAAQLNHPAAARILEQGEVRGVPYVAIEHVLGISLARTARAAQELGAWPLSAPRAAQVMAPVLDALAAAHALSPPLMHRELVPENVRIDGTGRVVLTDFGLGRARLRAGGGAGMRGAFISPEQARGNAIDARSEVFAAGLMLFELACGRLPAQGGAGEVVSRIATGELDAPRSVNPALDPALAAVLDRALAQKPEDRFATAAEFRAALAPWLAQPEAEPLGAWAQKLAMVQVAQAARPQVPAPTPEQKPAPAPEPAVEAAALPKRPPPTDAEQRAAKKRTRRIAFGVIAVGALITSQAVDLRTMFGTATPEVAQGRTFELVTIPSGAQVWVDGVLEERRTPLTLYFPKDEFKSLTLRKQGLNPWSGLVYNTRRLEVTLATGELEEEKYEGQSRKKPPVPAAPVTEPAAPGAVDAAPPKPEVVFDVEAPPIETTLTRAHSVRADLGPSVEVASGTELSQLEGASLYFSGISNTAPPSRNGSRDPAIDYQTGKVRGGGYPAWATKVTPTYRVLNLFALHLDGTVPVVSDLARPVSATWNGKTWFFTPTENGELSRSQAAVQVGEVHVPVTEANLLHVDAVDSFLVRVLQPKARYRLELTRGDGTKGPLPPVVMTLRPDSDPTSAPGEGYASSIRFDNAELASGQALVGPGVHTVTGARSVWFTLITAGDVQPPDVKLSMKPIQGLMPSKKGK